MKKKHRILATAAQIFSNATGAQWCWNTHPAENSDKDKIVIEVLVPVGEDTKIWRVWNPTKYASDLLTLIAVANVPLEIEPHGIIVADQDILGDEIRDIMRDLVNQIVAAYPDCIAASKKEAEYYELKREIRGY